MLEERRNATLRRTLETVGGAASRIVYEHFPGVLVHAFEPRSGAPLMEWLARELSLVDLAIAIDGLPTEVARWIANLDHRDLRRVFVTFRPDELTPGRAIESELERYDAVFASGQPGAELLWTPIRKTIVQQDLDLVAPAHLPVAPADGWATADESARLLEAVMIPGLIA